MHHFRKAIDFPCINNFNIMVSAFFSEFSVILEVIADLEVLNDSYIVHLEFSFFPCSSIEMDSIFPLVLKYRPLKMFILLKAND